MEKKEPQDLPDGVTIVYVGNVAYYRFPDGRTVPAMRGGAFIPLALAVAPYVPQMLAAVTAIVKAWSADPMTPEQYRQVTARHISNLEALVDDVMAVEIREVPPDNPGGPGSENTPQ